MDKTQLNGLIDLTMKMSDKAYSLFEANDITSEYSRISNDLLLLKVRLNKPELNVLISGEVKVGKSTFINCLVGEEICPSADEVCTNVPSMIKYGEQPKVIVHFKPNEQGVSSTTKEITREEIPNYSTETTNSKNREDVDYIEIIVNNPHLPQGLVLIDTPGLGALDPRHAVATFNMAAISDVIFFLGNTDKELSSFEIESLQQLITCSKCKFVAHILTCCDRGDAEIIYQKNVELLKARFANIQIPAFMISSLIYQKYTKNHNDAYVQKSGFRPVFSFIDEVGGQQEAILTQLCCTEFLLRVEELRSKISTIIETAEDPKKLGDRLKELEACKQRLHELSDKSSSWENSFKKKQLALQSGVTQFVSDSEIRIYNEIDELVKNDIYLENKEMLASAIQSKLTVLKNDLDKKIKDGMLNIYVSVKDETGFTKIQGTIHTPGFDITDLTLPDNCGQVSTFNTLRNHFGYFMMGGVVAHGLGFCASAFGIPALSAKIGAALGSFAPGIGNLIGAAGGFILGGIIALGLSLIQSKDTKRKKLAADCKKQLSGFFVKVKNQVNSALNDNSFLLSSQFSEELSSQQKECAAQIKKLQPMAVTARANWNTVLDINSALKRIASNFSTK